MQVCVGEIECRVPKSIGGKGGRCARGASEPILGTEWPLSRFSVALSPNHAFVAVLPM